MEKGQKNCPETKDEIETSFLALLEPQVVKFHGIFKMKKCRLSLKPKETGATSVSDRGKPKMCKSKTKMIHHIEIIYEEDSKESSENSLDAQQSLRFAQQRLTGPNSEAVKFTTSSIPSCVLTIEAEAFKINPKKKIII